MNTRDAAFDDERSRRRAAWMARVQEGDQDAYRALLDDIGPTLFHLLRRRAVDRHEAEDMYQDTLMALHCARHTYQPSRPVEPWLFAIARNVASDHARRRVARASREVLADALPDQPVDSAGDAEARLEQMLSQLPPAQREAFEMLKLEGVSIEVAAGRAGTTAGALRVRAHRAYRAIKALLHG